MEEKNSSPGMTIHCRILKIDIERFQADLSSRGSDLRDETGRWRPQLDAYYDHEEELVDKQKMTDKSKDSNRTTYIKRVIAHPSFHNIDFKAAERMMADLDQGDTVIRPSSKGCDHLTASWKVAEGPVCAHIDIREEKKENNFSLGRSLWIGPEEFEDLDEIIARFIQPMAANARDLIAHKNYRDVGGKKELVEDMLKQAKKQAPSRIPYFISASKALPGKFLLSYMPRTRSKHEYVSVTSDGYRYRAQMFTSLNHLFKWFKEHFRDPIPNHLLPHTPPATSSSHHVTPSTHHVTPSSHHVTPSSHHKPSSKSASSRLTPRTPYFTPNPNPGAGMDWGKAAQEWAKSSRAMPPSPLLTPRGPRTPKEPPSRTPKQHHHRTRAQPSGY